MVLSLIKSEGPKLEYKLAKNSFPKDAWRTYSAFANTKGGLLVLGVSDDLEIVGIQDEIKIKKDFFTAVNNPEKVSINLIDDDFITTRNIDGKTVLEIYIPEAPLKDKPVYLNKIMNQAFIRDFETDRFSTKNELTTMIRNSQDNLDDDLLKNFNLDDLDESSLGLYRTIISKYNSKFKSMPFEDMLVEIGAFRKDRESSTYKLTLGGLLFFGKYNSITEIIPHFHLDYQNKINGAERWSDRFATGDPNSPDINVFTFYITVLEKLKNTIMDEFKLSNDLLRSSSSNDVEISLREALANSLIHADYRENLAIKIEAHNSYYTFENPGNMRVSIEEFVRGGVSMPRNNIITTLFRRIGVCERAGSGGPQIFSTATKHKLRIPDISSNSNFTKLKMWKVDIADAYPELSTDAGAILKLLIKNMLPLSSSEIRESLDLTKYYFDKSVKELMENNLIEKEGSSRATKYTLKTSTPEHLASLHNMITSLQEYYVKK